MTGERLVGEPARSQRPGSPARALAVDEILGMCDRIVGQPGRRQHLFGWLKAPDAGAQQWLPVDTYYPAGRLVVVCRADPPGPDDHIYGELVPRHGLRHLQLTPAELGTDRSRAEARLRELIAATGPAPPRITEAPSPDGHTESPVARAMASLALPPAPAPPERRRVSAGQAAAAERGARFVAAHKADGNGRTNGGPRAAPRVPARAAPRVPARAAPRVPARAAARAQPQPRPAPATRPAPAQRRRPPASSGPIRMRGDDLALGAALVLIVFLEVYVLVVRTGLDQDRLVLAFGVALDAGARSLGTVAAARAGRLGWAWACAIGGSPVVAAFALFQSDGPVATEPAPLAGLTALLATFLVALALVGSTLGI
jgi:hypothetical protein